MKTYKELHKPASEFKSRSEYLEHELQIMKPRRYKLNLPGRDFRFEWEDLVPALAGTLGIIAMYSSVMMAWADGLGRKYRPEDGVGSQLWEDDEGFVTQRSGDGFVKGTRYATSEDQEEVIREIIKFSIPKQLTDKGYIAKK